MEKIHEHDVTEDKNDWMTYFSTHPEPYERIAKFRSEK
jgi:Zn-dependent protease with chaperone function